VWLKTKSATNTGYYKLANIGPARQDTPALAGKHRKDHQGNPMAPAIFVINPNSNEAVTASIDRAIECLRGAENPLISCITLEEGPPGIESQRDIDGVVRPLCRRIAKLNSEAVAFVIACFGDPGLHAARQETTRPVLGIAECSAVTALTVGQRFGVISILPDSTQRHLRYFKGMGIIDRLAGDRAIGLKVAELADREKTGARMIETGRVLRDNDGADVLIMGCAGMADYRTLLAEALEMPVIEPTQAAVAMALSRVKLQW
jgi:allantoin racemase